MNVYELMDQVTVVQQDGMCFAPLPVFTAPIGFLA